MADGPTRGVGIADFPEYLLLFQKVECRRPLTLQWRDFSIRQILRLFQGASASSAAFQHTRPGASLRYPCFAPDAETAVVTPVDPVGLSDRHRQFVNNINIEKLAQLE